MTKTKAIEKLCADCAQEKGLKLAIGSYCTQCALPFIDKDGNHHPGISHTFDTSTPTKKENCDSCGKARFSTRPITKYIQIVDN